MLATLKKERFWYIALLIVVAIGIFQSVKPRQKLEDRLYEEAQEKIKQEKFNDAVEILEKIVSYSPQTQLGQSASLLGGHTALYEAKEYKKAIFFYRNVVRHNPEQKKIKEAQEKITEIYYEKLSEYGQAILELNRLLTLATSEEEKQKIQQKIAKTYYYDGNFNQASLEVDEFLIKWPESIKVYEMLTLKAGAQAANKKCDDAIKTYDRIIKDFGHNSGIEEIHLSKAQCYEEKKEWDKAIQILKDIKDSYVHPEVIDMRIKSIVRRKEKKKI